MAITERNRTEFFHDSMHDRRRGVNGLRRCLCYDACAALRRGVELEEALPYDEPRGWMQPVSHALGALLLESDRVAEAEEVYRADLAVNPENSWSLYGLAECLRRTGDVAAAKSIEARFKKAWSQADAKIQASCYCRAMK